jgi:hypothetical protein
MSTATKNEYLLLFRGKQWDKGLSPAELQGLMDRVITWFEDLQQQGKIKAGQPLGAEGRILSGKKGHPVADGPFVESKEAVGGYLLLEANDLDEVASIVKTNPTLEYGVSIEIRPVLEECPIFARVKKQLLAPLAA